MRFSFWMETGIFSNSWRITHIAEIFQNKSLLKSFKFATIFKNLQVLYTQGFIFYKQTVLRDHRDTHKVCAAFIIAFSVFRVKKEHAHTQVPSICNIKKKVPQQEIATGVFREHLSRCYANATLTQRIKNQSQKHAYCQAGSTIARNLLWCSWHFKNNSNPKKEQPTIRII